MNTDNFWNDTLVKEYLRLITSVEGDDYWQQEIERFKKAKLAPPPVKERIEVLHISQHDYANNDSRYKDRFWYQLQVTKPLWDLSNTEVMKKIEAALNEDTVVVPQWYSKDEIYEWLIHKDYSHQIANELAEYWWEDLQGAFKKGWQKATNDNLPSGERGEYKYYSPEKTDTVVEEQQDKINIQKFVAPVPASPKPDKPDWEILKVRVKVITDIIDYTPHYVYDWKNMFEIFSVRRLSDGSVFTVGGQHYVDNVKGEKFHFVIGSFEIAANNMMVKVKGENPAYNISLLKTL